MTRVQFLNDLYHHLYGLTQEQAEQHLTYYAEMLADRMEEGMSEEEAVAGMEDVETIARRIMEEEGLPYTPPAERPAVPPSYPDASRMGDGNQFTHVYQTPKKAKWKKAARIALWTVAAVAVVGGVTTYMSERSWSRRAADAPTDTTSVVAAETAPYAEGAEYADMPFIEGYEYTDGENYFDAGMVEGIDIEWTAGQVFIQSWGGDGVQVQEYSQSELTERTRMDCYLDGDVLKIRYRAGTGLINVKGSKWLTVLVPEGLMGEIDVSTMSAGVQIQGVELDTLRLDTTSGEVLLGECYTQTADLSTVSGFIQMERLWADQTEISTTSGYISGEISSKEVDISSISGDISVNTLENVEDIDVSTTSGDIWISAGNTALRDIDISSTSGDVALSLPYELGFTLDYSTISGNISISNFDANMREEGKYVYEGGECTIEVETVSGDLDVY